ncbi:hypothetical protein K469DRAFT_609452, partial [Zopfia rhizophila CBS 207.26]
DAISLNQEDIKKRNHGVRLMPVIYIRAIRTICWLGDFPLPKLPTLKETIAGLINSI